MSLRSQASQLAESHLSFENDKLFACYSEESQRGLVTGRCICNPEVPGTNPSPCLQMDLFLVDRNLTPPCLVNSQLVSLPPVGSLKLLCLIFIIFVCYAHLIIFTRNLCDINVNYYYLLLLLPQARQCSSKTTCHNTSPSIPNSAV